MSDGQDMGTKTRAPYVGRMGSGSYNNVPVPGLFLHSAMVDSDADVSDDEIQDWSLILPLSDQKVPRRGEKDYEPLAADYDSRNLLEARVSMFRALEAKKRGFACNSGQELRYTIRFNRSDHSFCILNAQGKFLESMGRTDAIQRTWFTKFEALYLIERGTCRMIYDEDDRYLLSLEECYTVILTEDGDIDKFNVYSYLKRNGYIVLEYVTPSAVKEIKHSRKNPTVDNIYDKPLFKYTFTKYSTVFNSLQLDIYNHERLVDPPISQLAIDFNVWKPQIKFQKKSPPVPDFQISVINIENDNFPTLSDINHVLRQSDTIIKPNRNPVSDLKFGKENILLATVDHGLFNFIKLSRTDFHSHGLIWDDGWLKKRPKKAKRGQFSSAYWKSWLRLLSDPLKVFSLRWNQGLEL